MNANLKKPEVPADLRAALGDRDERDRARLSLDRNVVVEAGAGTGKTTLLTGRALLCLLGRGVPVTELVALTFTEKAAGEIRVRLGDRLIELLAHLQGRGTPETASRCKALLDELAVHFKMNAAGVEARAQKALEDLDKATIGTLHSFAAQLLRAYPLEAGVDPGFQVDEGDFFDDLFETEWAAWLDRELGEHAPRGQEWLEVLRLAELEDLEALARALCEPRADLKSLEKPPAGMKDWLVETADILEAEPSRQPAVKGKIAEQMKKAAARLRILAAHQSARPPRNLPLADSYGASWPASWDSRHRERWESARRIAEKASPEGEALLRHAARLLLPFAEHFRKLYAWRGRISFDRMLQAARDLVRDHRRVREELKAKFRAFLIDEFQDTDPLQGELVIYLAEAPGHFARRWEEARLEPGKLFIVGDPKQSIYRFRGADLSAYERFIRLMKDQDVPAVLCELKSNFRSSSDILAAVNSVFERLMLYSEGSQPAYKPVNAETLSYEGVVEVIAVASPANKATPVDELRHTEAQWIARWIEEHCRGMSAGDTIPSDKHRYKDVAILLRTTTPLGEYLDILKERGIPYVVEGEKYFYGTQEIQDFLNLLRALDDPSDRRALAGLLRSPLIALTDAELYRLSAAGGLDYRKDPRLSAESGERVKGFFSLLRRLHAMRGRRPLGDFVREALEETHLLEFASAAYHGQQTLANLMKLCRIATAVEEGRGETLKGFIHKVSRFISQAREEGESPLADEQLDAVRVMTVHKSKGLEYSVVIVPNLSGLTSGGGDKPALVTGVDGAVGLRLAKAAHGAGILYLEETEKRREQDEAVRLLYVAMTRAKEHLILLGAKEPRSHSLAALLGRVEAWPILSSGVPMLEVQSGTRLISGTLPRGGRATVRPVPQMDVVESLWNKRSAVKDKLEAIPRFISPTGIKEKSPRKEFRPGAVPSSFLGAALGRLCHKVLENWTYRRDFNRDASRVLKSAVSSAWMKIAHDCPKVEERCVLEEANAILGGFLSSPAARALAEAEILGREIPFVFGAKGQVMRGTIDLLCRLDGGIRVVDYKTDSIKPADLLKKSKSYEPQMKMYAEAVSRALAISEVGYALIFLRLARAVERKFNR